MFVLLFIYQVIETIPSQIGSASKSHVTPPRFGDPGNATAAEGQWQKASLRRLQISGIRG